MFVYRKSNMKRGRELPR